ncbi:Xaa-Pro aminopeptidase [Kaistia algarum]|uniref:M24 family metallopeptidase n=1 Tax=Kaistia algarum TaxID=2083279 RepID=UPI000CE73847|nr:M24 family metallopeptidase [Kaistia algarum]MCX5512733.1 M24 family metallopeptidase [Kaistia algarum]PPE81760.1 Xaa-Pro aminopeptidase [Kaistia algarum]
MSIKLSPVTLPDFGTPLARPVIPAQTYAARVSAAYAAAGCDWLVVYADREHFANIVFLTGFEPRFEEALLLLGPRGERVIVTGNENIDYAPVAGLADIAVYLCQSLSLMGQDRSLKPNLAAVLRELGLAKGERVGLVGWKYVEASEWDGPKPTFFVPAYVVDSLALVVGDIVDATHVLMHPTAGLRAVVDADQIAEAEWAATRASLAVWRIISGFTLGDNELMAASRMGYAGEPMNCHPMFSTGDASLPVIGLKSPSARQPARGDGVTTAVSFWGGLTARGGLVSDHDDDFVAVASAYFKGLLAWYETADIGVEGGAIHEAVVSTLAEGGLRSALNPGHLTGHDEWMNSPIRPGSTETIASGMPFQIDIIPVPMPAGWTLNCEDPVTVADASLRAEIAARHPQVAARFEARRAYVRDQIGVEVRDNILLLSSIPLTLPPLWLKKGYALVKG